MPGTTILFGIVLSTAYGAAFHVWRGGSLRRLFFYLLLAWAGFWAGDLLGYYMGWNLAAVGSLNAGVATLAAAVFLLVGDYLSKIEFRAE